MWSKWGIVVLVALLVSACGTKRKVAVPTKDKSENATLNIDNMEINNLDFHSFAGRAKAKVDFGTQNQDVTMSIRIERDKIIWISVTALLGIEVARVKITPDSVQILNKLQGEYVKKPFSYIYRYTNPGITFVTLQDLLMANVSKVLLRTDQLTVATSEDEIQLVGVKDSFAFQYSLNGSKRPRAFRLVPTGTDQSLEALYARYVDFEGYYFPQNQNIKLVSEQAKVNAQLEYTKVEFNQVLEYPFSIPARYKVIE